MVAHGSLKRGKYLDTISKGRLGYNIVPIDFISQYRSSIGSTKLELYKNNFSQLEPLIGNN